MSDFARASRTRRQLFRGPWVSVLLAAIAVALWLPWSIVIDYVSLLKTRFVLGLLVREHRRSMVVAIAILAMDYIAYKFIFGLGLSLALMMPFLIAATSVSVDPGGSNFVKVPSAARTKPCWIRSLSS